jgi:hypothetical protein
LLGCNFYRSQTARPEATILQSACPKARDWLTKMNMWPQPQLAQDPAEWLGDAHPLVEQLGSADGPGVAARVGGIAAHATGRQPAGAPDVSPLLP